MIKGLRSLKKFEKEMSRETNVWKGRRVVDMVFEMKWVEGRYFERMICELSEGRYPLKNVFERKNEPMVKKFE